MNMTARQIIDAYKAVVPLCGVPLPFKKARELANLRNALKAEVDVITAQERATIERFDGKETNGKIEFGNALAAQKYQDAMDEFLSGNADVDIPLVDLCGYTDGLEITADGISALSGIILFGEEG